MRSARRSGAPRLIEWTGERCVPWAPDVRVVYEHLHRYAWAANLVKGRRVLDLASGEGFGAAILVEQADSVLGIELDPQTVAHSRLNYGGEKLEFEVGDALDLSRFESGSFGAVVAFEMIEHVEDQERVLAEISRVLVPDGLLVMSSPDRSAYTAAREQQNPFHVRELDRTEFVRLVCSRFANVAVWGQRTITGSALAALDGAASDLPARTIFVERKGDSWEVAGGPSPLYLVTVASNVELPPIPRDSTLADTGLALLRAAEQAGAQAAESSQREAAAEVQRLQQALSARDIELQQALSDRDIELQRYRGALEELEERKGEITALRSELAAAQQLTERVRHSVSWKLFERARDRGLALLGGQGSLRTRALRRALRGLAEGAGSRRAAAVMGPLGRLPSAVVTLPEFDQPQVSIVIPLYSGADLTKRCLESIRDRTGGIGYEVILVDDGADRDTKLLLSGVRGARIIVNKTNLGYLRSVNLGASRARGRWIVLCNNDIEVFEGWLTEMLRCGGSSPDIGIVTPKYLYPDGLLSEAGAIIFKDGSGVNYGRGEQPSACRYEFRREVDYGSAAALMVRADLWSEVGGFDERFAPMYFEDVDLCFQAREHGLKVMYEPRANVIHVEGSTAGTDVTVGHKRYQDINRPQFVAKWRHRLDREQLRPSSRNVRRAANRNRGPHVLIVDHRVPTWDRDSGSLRMLGMIKALIDLGCRVTLLPDDRHFTFPYTVDLMRLGVEVLYGDVDLSAELSELGPGLALIITCRPQPTSYWLDRLREYAPSVPIVYDTVDLHWLREARRAALAEGSEQIVLGPKAIALREIELALIRATDATLVVTADERAQVEADAPGAVVKVVPNVNEVRAQVPSPSARAGVLFIGGFEHTPNVDAAVRLVRRIMPQVWAVLSDVPVTIVGGSPPPEVEALASPLVDVTGWVQDVDPLVDSARAMLAPLSYGAGLKGKVTQALAAGLPVVTTPVGAEGLDATSGEQLLVGADDRALAEHVINILRDDELWARLSAAGQRLAAESFSPAIVAERLREVLADCQHLRARSTPASSAA